MSEPTPQVKPLFIFFIPSMNDIIFVRCISIFNYYTVKGVKCANSFISSIAVNTWQRLKNHLKGSCAGALDPMSLQKP